ncbi:helix-turn-helix domain-containing protein [Falsiroseomonas oryzae]|uniref:helix-turn-helix domain-containing protein n=1 Tax=Falsiroseomonas oryzae TaxID=2766473 RepID=UPI0038CC16F8
MGGVAREIQRERLRCAHRAIAEADGARTLHEIGEEFGFPEPTTFSRAFRREFGYPPSELRRTGPCVPVPTLATPVHGGVDFLGVLRHI